MTTSQQKPVKTSSTSRRALLAGAMGGIGAAAVAAIGRASPVQAADGDAMVVGGEYTSTSVTKITNTANPQAVIWGNSGSGAGVWGTSQTGQGVIGGSYATNKPAVLGVSEATGDSTGVLGASGALPAAEPKTGVYGYAAQDASSRGVLGHSPQGHAVHGRATSGTGLFGQATSGFAIRGTGRVKFGKVSGVATIAAGNVSVLVSPGVNVTSGSFVLLTPKVNIGSRGLWFSTNAAGNTITIRMSSTRSSGTKVAWLLLG